MTVAQIKKMAELVAEWKLAEDKKVNFTTWRDVTYVTLSFMNNDGEVWRYNIQRDGTYTGERSL